MEIKDFRILVYQITDDNNFYAECIENGEFSKHQKLEGALEKVISDVKSLLLKTSDSEIYRDDQKSSGEIASVFESSPNFDVRRVLITRSSSLDGEYRAKFTIKKTPSPLDSKYLVM